MAMFYNHIKGCGNLATNTHTGTYPSGSGVLEHNDVWSFIKFADIMYYTKESSESTSDLTSIKNSPIIYLNSPNISNQYISNTRYSADYTAAIKDAGGEDKLDPSVRRYTEIASSLGHILTTNAKDQYVNKDFEFKKRATINNLLMDAEYQVSQLASQHLVLTDKRPFNSSFRASTKLYWSIDPDTKSKADEYIEEHKTSKGKIHTDFTHPYIVTYFEKNAQDHYYLYIGRDVDQFSQSGSGVYKDQNYKILIDIPSTNIQGNAFIEKNAATASEGNLTVANKCEALYFNAISDERAKTNITSIENPVLPIVQSLPIYSFTYKDQPDKKVLGLIAQEAAKYDLNGFNMVENLEATGQDDDMMKIKESKLVYILWKAVQELSAEVEELKAEIRNLK